MEIGDLESKWDQQYAYNNDSGEEDVVVDENNMNAANMLGVEGSGVTKKATAATVHMDLFYNGEEQEYNGIVHDENSANKVGYAC